MVTRRAAIRTQSRSCIGRKGGDECQRKEWHHLFTREDFLTASQIAGFFSASLRKIPFTTTMTDSLITDLHSAANEERIEEFTNTQAFKHPIMMLSTITVK